MTNKTQKLQSLLNAQVGKGGLRNIVAAVQSYDKGLDLVGAAGVADPATGAPMTPETPYFIASVTKMYTAAIIMQLHQEKRLDLQAPVSDYLPDALLDGIHVYKGVDYSRQLKVFQLVNQTSGLADFETDKPRRGKSVLDELTAGHDRAIDTAEALRITRTLSPHFAPGTPGRAYYSNLNYRLLGEIIQSITGKPMAINLRSASARRWACSTPISTIGPSPAPASSRLRFISTMPRSMSPNTFRPMCRMAAWFRLRPNV
jgi:CubicO group peptidase (beta-lactamase class C family)